MKIITINNLIKIFKNFADKNKFINDFGYGQTSDIGRSREMKFPYLWVTHSQSSSINIENKLNLPNLSFTFIIVDQINQQENYEDDNGLNSDNQQEIISDTFQTHQDLVQYISGLSKYGISLESQNVNIIPMFDETVDKVSGWSLTLDIKIKHSNCILPVDYYIEEGEGNDIKFLTCDTLRDCKVIIDIREKFDEYLLKEGGTISGELVVNIENWIFELMDKQEYIFYPSVRFKFFLINSIVGNNPDIKIEVNDNPYVLGDIINRGDKVKVISDIPSVVELKIDKS